MSPPSLSRPSRADFGSSSLHLAIGALDNLKAKFKSIFKNKEEKKAAASASASAPAATTTAPPTIVEPTKTEDAAAPVPAAASTSIPKCCNIKLAA